MFLKFYFEIILDVQKAENVVQKLLSYHLLRFPKLNLGLLCLLCP